MEEERSLANVLKALPDLLRMEHTYGTLATVVKQWGLGNTVSILLKAVRRTGLVNSLTGLLSFKLDKLAPNFFVSMWAVFGDREAIISGGERIIFVESLPKTAVGKAWYAKIKEMIKKGEIGG